MSGTATSIIGSIADGDKDYELAPQKFFRMNKKRKPKLIHSLRNKPIEVNTGTFRCILCYLEHNDLLLTLGLFKTT